ncbi:hypothetical protein PJP13_24255 [Mycobacterium kansasii]
MSAMSVSDVFDVSRRIWEFAPDPIALAAGEVSGPTRRECEQLAAAQILEEVERGEPVNEFAREWAESVVQAGAGTMPKDQG